MREIPDTKLLVSLNHYHTSANMEIFDLSQRRVKKMYSFAEVEGGIELYNTLLIIFKLKKLAMAILHTILEEIYLAQFLFKE